ncbi:hypothetical protein PG985_010562 [Apiospora marii]|uniref:Uncharacterized protein n=1 Tax=Apiospora marii TaxID=335849 RepID=A0ABR1T199_9PEZI
MHFTFTSICVAAMATVLGTASSAVAVPTAAHPTPLPGAADVATRSDLSQSSYHIPWGRRQAGIGSAKDVADCDGDFATVADCGKACDWDAGRQCVTTIDIDSRSVKTSCCRRVE